ncbi:MAG: hypothetical protein LUE27_11015 [Clostridia bacterium]|nr:hypothetical protein [Clostridia bacterium]
MTAEEKQKTIDDMKAAVKQAFKDGFRNGYDTGYNTRITDESTGYGYCTYNTWEDAYKVWESGNED